jgi:hypothetical protein
MYNIEDYNLNYSVMEKITADFYKQLMQKFDAHLKSYIQTNLSALGFTFDDDSEFISFVKKRVFKIDFSGNPNQHDLYLDFVDAENKGILIGTYCDEVSFKMDTNTYTATIGTTFK